MAAFDIPTILKILGPLGTAALIAEDNANLAHQKEEAERLNFLLRQAEAERTAATVSALSGRPAPPTPAEQDPAYAQHLMETAEKWGMRLAHEHVRQRAMEKTALPSIGGVVKGIGGALKGVGSFVRSPKKMALTAAGGAALYGGFKGVQAARNYMMRDPQHVARGRYGVSPTMNVNEYGYTPHN